MVKIALIGAGSQVFSRRLVTDILSFPDLRDNTTIALMDIDEDRLHLITAFAKKLVRQYGSKTKVESTTNRNVALDDADYVTAYEQEQEYPGHKCPAAPAPRTCAPETADRLRLARRVPQPHTHKTRKDRNVGRGKMRESHL